VRIAHVDRVVDGVGAAWHEEAAAVLQEIVCDRSACKRHGNHSTGQRARDTETTRQVSVQETRKPRDRSACE
jgi:hypothetical protein